MKRLAIIAAAVAVLALAAVAVGGAATSAQEGDGPIGSFLAKVADKLGVSQDELEGAFKDARLEMIDEAEADGRITAEEAERMRQRVEEGDFLFPPRPPGEGRDHPRRGPCQLAVGLVVEAAAHVLDMSKDDLVEELKEGKSLAQVAEDQGMGLDEFTGELLAQVQAQLDDRVAEGKLTAEEAERIFQAIEEHIDRIVNAVPGPHGPCKPDGGKGPCQLAVGLVVEAAAQALDMSKDDLVEELKEGKSLAQVAEDQGMGLDEFTSELLAQVQAQLDDRVAEGKLTAEEAERIFQVIEEHIDRIVNAAGPHGPCPPRNGPRDFGGPEEGPRDFGGPERGPFGDEPPPPLEPPAE